MGTVASKLTYCYAPNQETGKKQIHVITNHIYIYYKKSTLY